MADVKHISIDGTVYDIPGASGVVSGVKGENESTYRTGNVNITRSNLGLGTAATKNVATSGDASTSEAVMGNDTRLTNSRTPTSHASTATTYGRGNATNFGHVKVSDTYTSLVGNASQGVSASQKSVNDVYNLFNARLPVITAYGVNSVTASSSVQVLLPSKTIKHTNAIVCGRLAFNKGTNDCYYVQIESSTNNSTWTAQAGFYYYPAGALSPLTFAVPCSVNSSTWYLRITIKLQSGTASSPTVNNTGSVSTITVVTI